jgi:molybdenum cofactor biosynthesis protein B
VARDLLTKANHKVIAYKIVRNNSRAILDAINKFLENDEIDVVITSGGTGEVGEAAMISRATAGIIGTKILFCIPGSTKAMELALTHLILPGIGHILWEVNR